MFRISQRALAIFALMSFTAHAGVSASQKVALPSEVTVHTERMTLAGLLPSGAPQELRAAAARVALGYAPRLGTTRVLLRDQLERRARQARLPALGIPERVVVRRWSRSLTRQEIVQAILASLEKNGRCGNRSCVSITAENLLLPVAPAVTSETPALRLLRMEQDARRLRVRFRLWDSSEPAARPFDVYVSAARNPAMASTAGPSRAPQPTLLVLPGRPARLVIVGRGFRGTTPVMALQRGSLGQTVRVQNPVSRAVLLAEVIGPQEVRRIL